MAISLREGINKILKVIMALVNYYWHVIEASLELNLLGEKGEEKKNGSLLNHNLTSGL